MSNEETEQADAEEETLQYDFEVMRRNKLDWRQERNQYDFRTGGILGMHILLLASSLHIHDKGSSK